jgi:sterol desaturase/sphingolipid hydroxylase (fatty acid hydroxylase superfamily)
MSSQNFGTQVAFLLLSMALISGIEGFAPLYARYRSNTRTRVNLTLTASVLGLNWLVSTLAVLMLPALQTQGFGILPLLNLPLVVQIFLGIAGLDFFTYVAHVAMHQVPLLWKFHRVHHSDPFVDVTTSYRFHPFEAAWRLLWIFLPALALGVPWQGLVIYRMISATNGLFEHANLAVPSRIDSPLSLILVTPNMHKVHHSSTALRADSNYGNILALYDRAFGTFTSAPQASAVEYGSSTLEPSRVASLHALLLLPFERTRVRSELGDSG